MILTMIVASGLVLHVDVQHLRYYGKEDIVFEDTPSNLTRTCTFGQYGVYFTHEAAFQILGCQTDTIYRTGHELGEVNRPPTGGHYP